MVGSASDPLSERHGWTADEVRSHWNWAPGLGFLNNSEFSLTWRLARNALPLLGLNFRVGLSDMPDCTRCSSGLEETAEQAFYYCERVHSFWEWTVRIEPKRLVLLDVGYVVDNVLPPFQGEKRVVFLAILAVARWCPRDVMVKAMDYWIVVREFVLHLRYYVHFRANTLGKGMDPLILPAMG